MARRRKKKDEERKQPEQATVVETRVVRPAPVPKRQTRVTVALEEVRKAEPRVYRKGQQVRRAVALPRTTTPEKALAVPQAAKAPEQTPDTRRRDNRMVQRRTVEVGAQPLDRRRCKRKPKATKGGGGGRKFVPWCR